MASFDFQDKEKRELRRQHEVRLGQIFVRTYRLPADDADTLIPARGDVVSLRDVTLDASDLLKPRVIQNPRRTTAKGGFVEVELVCLMPQAYS